MTFEAAKLKRKSGDTIQSEDWNQIVAELADLRKYIDNMAHTTTMTGLVSPVGRAYSLHSASQGAALPEDFDCSQDVAGMIDRQYFLGMGEVGDICKFGIMDYADVITFWSGATNGNREALEVEIGYWKEIKDKAPPKKLFIHECSKLQVRGNNNPYKLYWQLPNNRVWYQYDYVNPYPEVPIQFVVFRDIDKDANVRIGNVLQYTKRVRQLGPVK